MDVTAALIELKPDSHLKVSEWAEFILKHKQEAEVTLRAEGVIIESWFSLSIESKDYLLCYMRSKFIEEAQSVVK